MPLIGVFDSGVGGLTVVRALRRRLPHASILYLGDTARVPYGTKSPETVRRFSREAADFLAARGISALVVACNTASALAVGDLQRRYPFPVLGVLEPGARAAVRAPAFGPIGVIGTPATIRSQAYGRAIAAMAPEREVVSVACPLFVPLAEEGMVDHPATRLIARDYLRPLRERGVRVVVLGCTHYPILAPVIAEIMGPDVVLVDSAEAVAHAMDELRLARRSPAEPGATPTLRCHVTDTATRFREVGERFLGTPLPDVEPAHIDSV